MFCSGLFGLVVWACVSRLGLGLLVLCVVYECLIGRVGSFCGVGFGIALVKYGLLCVLVRSLGL